MYKQTQFGIIAHAELLGHYKKDMRTSILEEALPGSGTPPDVWDLMLQARALLGFCNDLLGNNYSDVDVNMAPLHIGPGYFAALTGMPDVGVACQRRRMLRRTSS